VIEEQVRLWSAAPRDWAELAEPQNAALFERLLDVCLVGEDTRMLDVACGSGYAAALAMERGARVTGVDVTAALLEIARERAPAAAFVTAGMDALPFADGSFDVVTGVNGFQFALDPAVALAEAVRVLAPGGRLAAATFAEPERNEGTALHLAMKALVEESEDGYTPYALSDGLADAVRAAGARVTVVDELAVAWRYPDAETTIRALLASAGGARSVRAAGESAVREALTAAMAPFVDASGAVTIHNVFRYVIAVRP
jgi:ubiquinone/menaquinone biosynthesis C-methylase UbiE